jgi:Curlin associated repeat
MIVRPLILALALAATGAVEASAQTPWWANRVQVEQNGSDNQAVAAQRGRLSRLAINQNGRNNAAAINQSGAANDAQVHQFGRDHAASVTQTGVQNDACVVQIGRGESVAVTQTGGQSNSVLQTPGGTREIPRAACQDGRVGRLMLRVLGRR